MTRTDLEQNLWLLDELAKSDVRLGHPDPERIKLCDLARKGDDAAITKILEILNDGAPIDANPAPPRQTPNAWICEDGVKIGKISETFVEQIGIALSRLDIC